MIFFRFLQQLNERFSEKNKDLFKLFEIFDVSSNNFFNPNCPHLIFFTNHYSYFQFNESKMLCEFPSAKSLILKKNITNLNLNDIISCLKDFPVAFSETLKIISLVLTLPISTASNERFFSSLKRVKSYIRSTMGDERLSDLLVVSVEKEEANKINLNDAVDSFSKLKNRRYPLM